MPSPTDFNLTPYYDDYSENKKFHRILFRPAFAVQARELTQSQTILQNQVERMSDHFFEKGSMVIPGEISYDLNYYSIKLTSFAGTTDLSNFVGVKLTGGTSGVEAEVVNSDVTSGNDPNTLYVKYLKAGTDNTASVFTAGETISGTAVLNGVNTSISAVVSSTHTGSKAEIAAGVYYINGFHIQVSNQVLVLDKYSNTPSYRVGLSITESFIKSTDDSSLLDNAQGSSNVNAPGADRFKIDLTLAKKTIAATDDNNFIELLRLSNGILQNQVRTTEYAVLEDTFARRTFDESGDYVVRNFDLDLREHISEANNRGIFTEAEGGLESKMAAGLSPGKAYVKGYEIETIGTTFVDLDKARDFNTQQNFSTKFDIGNFVNVTKVFGTPDVGTASGVTPFKTLNLFDDLQSSRGSAPSASGSTQPLIGRAKSRGFEYVSGTASSFVFSSASVTDAVYKHYLFDIEMFTHLNITSNASFTAGEKITGASSGATGTVQSGTAVESVAISSITVANPGVATATGHKFKEGQQISITGANFSVGGSAIDSSSNVFTVRNPATNTFQLYASDGTTSTNVTAFTSGGNATHGVVVLNNVQGAFVPGETITGAQSSNQAVIQANAVGFKGVTPFEFGQVKSLNMAGSPAYGSDVELDQGPLADNITLTGNINVTAGATAVVGNGTKFTTELRVGDIIAVNNAVGGTVTGTIESIESDTAAQVKAQLDGSNAVSSGVVTRRRTKLQSGNKNTAIFKLPYEFIKTLKTTKNAGATDTNFKVRQQFVATLSSGTATIPAGTNETFVGLAEGDYAVSITSAGSSGTAVAGNVMSLTGNNANGGAIFTLGGSPTGKTLTLDFGTAYANAEIKVIGTVNRSIAGSKTKDLVSNQTTTATNQVEIESGTINLGKADIESLVSVKMSSGFGVTPTSSDVDVTSRFELDNGQRDNYYDVGRIKLKTGELTPTGQLLMTFNFFTHGVGDYFDVDSYISGGSIDYEQIPSYTSDTTGIKFELRDCLDFRPRVADGSTINGSTSDRSFTGTGAVAVNPVKFGDDVTADFEYYLGRIDKIFLDKEGNFKVSKGASSLTPQVPVNLDSALHLYTLEIPAYTLSTEDVVIKEVDNTRYTMRDIGKLEDRIRNLEYYTQLSMLEQNAQSLQIQDANGFDRFKNGFIVDNFTGHNIGDVGNSNYKASIAMADGELRPIFFESNVPLIEADDDGTAILAADRNSAGYQKTGDVITLPYSEVTLIDQPYASKTINVNPFDVITWSGTVTLSPSGDEWKETERAPELIINNVGGFDTLASNLGNSALNGFEMGTIWNEWQDTWTGRPVDIARRDVGGRFRDGRRVLQREEVDTITRVQQRRSGIRQRIVPQTVRNSIGDRIISVAFIPFIRARAVSFTATRMKPNTRVYPFFDNIDVTAYVTPTGDAAGGNLVTDSNGTVTGTFNIPDPKVDTNDRWRTGQRVFRLTSSPTNSKSTDVETSAEADYIARGLLETVQNTIISTREPRIVRESTSESRSISRTSTRDATRQVGWHDPLAQTFITDEVGGVFMSSLDIYFATKDDNIPVTVQIREVVNGYPSSKILPFSEVTLNPSSVNTSTDSTTATTFTFDSPVYIQENVEYCFVVLAMTNKYTVYASRLGETQIGSNRTISQQPYAGVLFKSQNGSTWTADQNEDLKFKVKRCEFSTSPGTLTLCNDSVENRTLNDNPLRTTSGSNVVRVFHRNHGMHATTNNVTISGVASGTYNGIPHTELNATFTSISNVTLDSYDVTVSSNASATGDTGGSSISATQNRLFDVAQINLQVMEVPGTSIGTTLRSTSGSSIHGSETPFLLQATTETEGIVINDNVYFTAPRMIASDINQTNEMVNTSTNPAGKSVFLNTTLSTTNSKLSPFIDLQRASIFCIQNRLNAPTTGNTPDFVADTTSVGGSSSSSYITRPLTLENPSTAIEIRLSSNVRSSSSVRVFFRATSSEEVRNINDLDFTAFNVDGREDVLVASC